MSGATALSSPLKPKAFITVTSASLSCALSPACTPLGAGTPFRIFRRGSMAAGWFVLKREMAAELVVGAGAQVLTGRELDSTYISFVSELSQREGFPKGSVSRDVNLLERQRAIY